MTIQRHFLGWDRPALPVAAEYLIDKYATQDALDLSGIVLVFSGRRASRRMLELLVEVSESRWPALVPPTMTTFDRFPELLYPQKLRLADDLSQLLVWRKALREVDPKELQPAISELPPEESLSSWIALSDSLRKQHDELAAEGLDFDDVFRSLAQDGIQHEADRWKALRRIQAEYLWQMDELKLWDRQSARLIAVDQNECATDRDILLVGTVDINGIVRKMLDQVGDRVTALIHAPESEADAFDQHGCLIAERWQDRQIDIPDQVTVVADDPVDQAECVVRQLATCKGRYRADEIAVGVADESLVPPVVQGLANAGVAGRWPVGAPIRSSRPWRLLEAVAAHLSTAQEGRPPDFASLSNLVRHPDVSHFVEQTLAERRLDRTEAGRVWLTQLDDYLAKHLQPVPGKLIGGKERRTIVGGICSAIEQLLQQLLPSTEQRPDPATGSTRRRSAPAAGQQSLPFDGRSPHHTISIRVQMERRRPLNAWARGMLQLLAAVYANYEVGRDVQRDESIEACIEALKEVNDALAAIPVSVMPRCTAAQAIPVILSQFGGRLIPAPADESAIDLMGWLELPMDDSPVVTVAGFNEGRIPQSATSDVFLPNSVRSRLGLTDNQRRYARDAWALETLLHNREQLTLIAGRRDVEGDPLTPSRLWFAGRADDVPERVLRFYRTDVVPTDADGAMAIPETQPARISGFTVPAPPVNRPVPEQIAVTDFRVFIDCPYRYLLERELGLTAVEDRPREMDAKIFGNLIHDVLHNFGQTPEVCAATAPQLIETQLFESLEHLSRRQFGNRLSATVAVQLQMLKERLKAFAVWQADQAKDGWRIRFAERPLILEDFRDSQGRAVGIKGRIDRIEQNEISGQWRVVDYKSGDTPKTPNQAHLTKGEWVDLQLPLYRLLVETIGVTGDVKLGFVNLPGDLSKVKDQIADWTDDMLDAAEKKAREVAADILDLKIETLSRKDTRWSTLFRICQDTVVNPEIPWLNAEVRRVRSEE